MSRPALGTLFGTLVAMSALIACTQTSTSASPAPAPPAPEETTAGEALDAPDASSSSSVDAAPPRVTGCGSTVRSGPRQLTAKGKPRTYHLAIPDAYDASKPHPLVVVLHGATDTDPAAMRDWFPVQANVAGAIGVYPQALPRTHLDGSGGNVTRWDTSGDEDLLFFDALLADVDASTCIDRTRVFATGFSSGGNFAQQLGCLRAKDVRAIAPVAGPGPFEDTCPSPMAVWMTHDANDEALPVAGARASRDFWRAQNGCKGTWQADPSNAACKRDVSCPASAPLVYCETKGVGHDVPDFAATAIARFFGQITP